jgi:hypothetical protein
MATAPPIWMPQSKVNRAEHWQRVPNFGIDGDAVILRCTHCRPLQKFTDAQINEEFRLTIDSGNLFLPAEALQRENKERLPR